MKKYETEFKLTVVKSFLAGEGGAKLLAHRWNVTEEKIRTWVGHFDRHGLDGLRPKRSTYSTEFKLQALAHQDRDQLSNRQVAAIYDIRNSNQVMVWRRKLAAGGVSALERKRPMCEDIKPNRSNAEASKVISTDEAHALQKENEQLRAEVAYLKKLQALIRSKRSAAPTKRG